MSTPNRRATDQGPSARAVHLAARLVRFLATYRAALWTFIASMVTLAALTLAAIALSRVSDQATLSEAFGRSSCERAQKSIPIQIKALRAAERAGIVTAADVRAYAALRPEGC